MKRASSKKMATVIALRLCRFAQTSAPTFAVYRDNIIYLVYLSTIGSYRELQATDADWTEGIFTVAAVIELRIQWDLAESCSGKMGFIVKDKKVTMAKSTTGGSFSDY
jgi:hypothetical protein